jgi:hypothetical protein
MTDLAKKFAVEVLLLSYEDSVELIDKLLGNFNSHFQEEINRLLAEEAKKT